MSVGRNDLCPCGSGKKFKKCCRPQAVPPAAPANPGGFRFEAGAYGVDRGFLPSLACLKRGDDDEWTYHFVLAKPGAVHLIEEDAVHEAVADISLAHDAKQSKGSDVALAMVLRRKGYKRVDDFELAPQQPLLA
jgi:hypothetical protein